MRSSRTIIAVLTTQLLLVSSLIVGQTAPANPSEGQIPVVEMNLMVADSDNHFVDDIAKGDVKVFEDKVEQTVLLVEKDQRPVDYGIVIDASKSFKDVIGPALEAVRLIINNNRATDETFIVRFVNVSQIEMMQEMTSDKALLLKALKLIKVDDGQSALLDALYVSVDYAAKHAQKDRRQALVLITDGEDRRSFYTQDQLFKVLRNSNVQVFIIGITFLLDKERLIMGPSPRDKSEKLLTTIAQESGGRLFLAANVGELAKAVIEINHDLQSQFVLHYRPTNTEKTGFRKVEIKMVEAPGQKKWKAIAPRGYYLNGPDANSKSETKKP